MNDTMTTTNTDVSVHWDQYVQPGYNIGSAVLDWKIGKTKFTLVVEDTEKNLDIVNRVLVALQVDDRDEIRALVREFFAILEATEDSEMSGKEFHPTTISSCRVMVTERLKTLLPRLKELCQVTSEPDAATQDKKEQQQ